MDSETVDAPPEPSAASSSQEAPQTSVATPRYQGVHYETAPPLSTGKECLYLRGVPLDAQPETIMEFLGPDAYAVVSQGVHIIYNAGGQPSGDAIIQMYSEECAFWAVVNSHGRYMKGQKPSCIEALLCSVDEMKAMLAGARPVPFPESGAGEPHPELDGGIKPDDQYPVSALEPAAVPTPSTTFNSPGMPSSSSTVSPEACRPNKANLITMVLVTNLPESATVDDIKAFFGGFPGLEADAVYMRHHADPRLKGSAFVAVPCLPTAVRAVLDRQCHYIANHKVNLFIVDTDCVLRWLRAPSRAHLYSVPE